MAQVQIHDGVHSYSEAERYVAPMSEAVQKHIEWFTGLKFGLMMHWAPGCQLATYESWPLCDEEEDWARKDIDWTCDMQEFKNQYWSANKTFNPVKFRPDFWADFARQSGFKYVLFTTKHHDGFCMFDTATTDYKITAPDCPFHTHRYAHIVKEVFNAFRNEGLAISAYFSKPDWHSPYYWAPEMGPAHTRNVNYHIPDHPELWEKFVAFTHRQIEELCTQYGKIDVLWLDGGQVSPHINHQDIRLGEIVEKIRKTAQPHLIVCDRTVGGEYENIITPEQAVPPDFIPCPWESCITAGDYFSFHYEDNFKSPHKIIALLIEIVSKGGNLALNIPPQPDGCLPAKAMRNLLKVGQWLKTNGEGIYNTKGYALKQKDGIYLTQTEKNLYAFYLYDENTPSVPRKLILTLQSGQKIASAACLRTGSVIPFEQKEQTVWLDLTGIPILTALYAECFKLILQ